MQKHKQENDDVIQMPSDELYERMSLKVDKGQEPMRIDKFLVQRIEHASRNKIQHAIETGRVLVNNKAVQPNHKIKPQDDIIVYSDKELPGEKIVPEKMNLHIFFEDDDVLIIN
ncbi:MAG: RNA pseudouridine synthase, partial [Bacteroidetes bacterium]|nr:RNA pseudouridine synthase [Bacteroidota bacterium]